MQEELFVVDENNVPIPGTKNDNKEYVHRNGSWHRSAVYFLYDKKLKKLLCSCLLDYSNKAIALVKVIGGHVRRDEDVYTNHRELFEETGLTPKNNDIEIDFLYLIRLSHEIDTNLINNEFMYVYLVKGQNMLRRIHLDKREIKHIFLMEPRHFLDKGLQNGIEVECFNSELTKIAPQRLYSYSFKDFDDYPFWRITLQKIVDNLYS